MFTLYRPAYYDNPRASSFVGLSTDEKPLDEKNGALFEEIDTGKVFRFDEENKVWHEEVKRGGGTSVYPYDNNPEALGQEANPGTSDNYSRGDHIHPLPSVSDLGALPALNIANEFSTSSTYAVGDYVIYEGQLYQCTTAVTTAGSWNSSNWVQAVLGNDVGDLKSAIINDETAVNGDGYTANLFPYSINSENKWTSVEGSHVLIPVKSGDNVKIKANSTYSTYFGMLTSFDTGTPSTRPKFSTVEEYTSRIALGPGSEHTYTVPSDAIYMALNYLAPNGNNYFPQAVSINGVDVLPGVRKLIATLDAKAATITNAIVNQSFASGTDLDDIMAVGQYRLSTGGTYLHTPIGTGHRRLLIVSSSVLSGAGSAYQVIIGFDTGEIYTRTRHDGIWDDWVISNDTTARKIALGNNPYRKSIDHGGFYNTKYGNKVIYQNSPESFITSMKEGIVFHNLDIVFSSDGVPFVSHDVSVPETGGTHINLNNLTAEQIKTYMIGDSDYSWELQTLAECNAFIKSIGGVIDMVDISSANNDTQKGFTGALPFYYRANNIKPTWTNTDYDSHRDLFIQNGPEFGVYMVCNSAQKIVDAVNYIETNPNHKYCLNVAYSNVTTAAAFDEVIEDVVELGVSIYVYTYNSVNMAAVPGFADGVVSENANANYWQWSRNMT